MAKVKDAIQTAIGLILMLLIGAAILAYLLNRDSSGADGCRGSLVPDPHPGSYGCVLQSEAIKSHATIEKEAQMDEWERQGQIADATWRAEREKERDADYRREMEDIRKDAIRSCILAGNNADLCALDPGDPYGINDRN